VEEGRRAAVGRNRSEKRDAHPLWRLTPTNERLGNRQGKEAKQGEDGHQCQEFGNGTGLYNLRTQTAQRRHRMATGLAGGIGVHMGLGAVVGSRLVKAGMAARDLTNLARIAFRATIVVVSMERRANQIDRDDEHQQPAREQHRTAPEGREAVAEMTARCAHRYFVMSLKPARASPISPGDFAISSRQWSR